MMRRGRPGGSDDDDDDDSDDEELRALRAARAGGGRTQDGPPDLGEDAFVSKPRSGGGGGALEENEIEMAAVEDDTRLNFPMSFAQGKHTGGPAGKQQAGPNLQDVHAGQKREKEKKPTGPGASRAELEAMMQEMMEAARKGKETEQEEAKPAAEEAADTEQRGGGGDAVMQDSKKQAADEEEDDDDEEEEEDDDDEKDYGKGSLVPCSHEAILKGHTKAVTTMSLDPSASRLLTGGYDCMVKMWDFNGMNSALKSFRELTPWDGQQLKSLQYSMTGAQILCATTKNTALVMGREGGREVEFAKGDMYVHDMAQTKGHVSAITAARWDPKDKALCMTASIDATVRVWDINTANKKHLQCIKTKNQKGQRCVPTAITYTPSGDIVAACDDGSIKLFDGRAVAKGISRPQAEAKTAHMAGSETTCVSVSSDGKTLLSRGRDDTLKVWDLRKLSGPPLKSFGNLENLFDTTEAIFSPGDHVFLTGVSVRKNKDGTPMGPGTVKVYDKSTLEEVRELSIPSGSVVSLAWHPKINQLFVGSQMGQVHVLYDPKQSENGIMRCLGKKVKARDITSVGINQVGHIYAPHALPMFKEEKFASNSKQKRKDRSDPVKSSKPDLGPVAAALKGLAYPGQQQSRSFAQHLFKNDVGISGQEYLQQDPREALLKYSDKGVDDKPEFTGVYKETQPAPVFDYSEERKEKRAKPYVW
mmetsp:Transcript_46958/g.110589  ORF Transcript_46958/g.110589 Transcript_46958/m.110589 type:complete len:703 (+) Transcript_46958:92-2200(+)